MREEFKATTLFVVTDSPYFVLRTLTLLHTIPSIQGC